MKTLSDKINREFTEKDTAFLAVEDVKQAVEELKEKIKEKGYYDKRTFEIINDIFGGELTK